MRAMIGNDLARQRASRYAAAMDQLETSRLLELLPVASLCGQPGGALLDIMSGAGFVSRFLGDGFDRCDSSDMTDYQPLVARYGPDFIQCDASLLHRDMARSGTYDRIVCLAGFHHIVPPAWKIGDAEAVKRHRISTLARWRTLLAKGGRLIIGDVPAKAESVQSVTLPECIASNDYPTLHRAVEELGIGDFGADLSFRSNPDMFFHDFVSNYSCTGHLAQFESAESIVDLLRTAGFSNAKVVEYATPWIFSTHAVAIWFAYNLFGICGDTSGSHLDPSAKTYELVNAAVEKHLGIRYSTSGRCATGWRLLYAVAEV